MRRAFRPSGPKPGFTRDDAVDAALRIGVGTFTLARVARDLGVGTPALYRTISSRDDLLRACLDRLAAQIDLGDLTGAWPQVLRTCADRLWALLEDNPGLAQTLLTVPWAHQSFTPAVRVALRSLESGGLDRAAALLALDFVGDTVLGSHTMAEALKGASSRKGRKGIDPAAAPSTPGPCPWAGAALDPVPAGGPPGRSGFDPAAPGAPPAWPIQSVPDWLDSKINIIVAGINAQRQLLAGDASTD